MQNCVALLLLLLSPPGGEAPCDTDIRLSLVSSWESGPTIAGGGPFDHSLDGSSHTPGGYTAPDAARVLAPYAGGTTSAAPNVRRDLTRIYGATLLFSAVNPDVRGPFFGSGSLSRVGGHVRRPIRSAVEGWREDDDPFLTNFLAHPLSWGGIGYYLRSQGHSGTASLLMSQGHSLFWEYVLEGTYQKPSGKDLVTNLTSAWLGVALAGWVQAGEAPIHVELRPGAEGPGPLSLAEHGAAVPSASGYTLTVRLPI